MQLSGVLAVLALYVRLSNAELQIGGPIGGPVKPDLGELGSMALKLKEAAARSFLRTNKQNEQNAEEEDDESTSEDQEKVENDQHMQEEDDESTSDDQNTHDDDESAVEDEDTTQDGENTQDEEEESEDGGAVFAYNESDMWAYERENDDGTVDYGTDPFENKTFADLQAEDQNDDPSLYEQKEEEIPEEWTDPTNSTDEWAYEKANDDGTVENGTNPLEAPGFVWEGDEQSDEGEHHEKASADEEDKDDSAEPENQVVEPGNQVVLHSGTKSVTQESDDSESDEEFDDGTVLYGTNPLEQHHDEDEDEDEEDDVEYDDDGHQHVMKSNSTADEDHLEEGEEVDDGTVDYGTNPMEMQDDSDDEDDDEDYDRLNSTHIDDEPDEEYDDGTVLYGTNPLEESDEEEESGDVEAKSESNVKALPAPTSTPQDNETATQMSV